MLSAASLDPKPPYKHIAKTLIRLDGCQGVSESSMGADATLLVQSSHGSNYFADFQMFFSQSLPFMIIHMYSATLIVRRILINLTPKV